MCNETPEYEVRIKGHSLVKVSNGGVRVDGKDFHTDLKSLSELIEILHDVLDSAQEVKKPHLISQKVAAVKIHKAGRMAPFPYKVISQS